ncbi:MAG TPA: pirin family protein [Vicinamibacteria bacterium]|nr:pirin family protein [Vicinamibacteria bacterium]
MALRSVARVVVAQDTSDGGGVRLRRSVGTPQLDHVDPFLLLDEFKSNEGSDYVAGFPDHPHRGFETVTYMLAGAMEHRDHAGNRGYLVPGSVQWMTAGRGIVHSEMPKQEDGLMWGFQLWVNLPAAHKMGPPRYQDIPPGEIPERTQDDSRVRVIAGESAGVRGPVRGIVTEPLYLDVAVPPRRRFEHPVAAGHNGLVYVFEGAGEVGLSEGDRGRVLQSGRLGVLGDGDALAALAGDEGMRFLLIAARPIGEPIARYGPFVMNTREEIVQALSDFQSGAF